MIILEIIKTHFSKSFYASSISFKSVVISPLYLVWKARKK